MSLNKLHAVLGCMLVAMWLLAGSGCAKQDSAATSSGAAAANAATDADEHAGHDHDADDHEGHDHADHEHAGHDHSAWWCAEHGVPEDVCGQCNSKLAAEFQKKGDWCEEHDRPDSQCFICHPNLQAKFAAQYEAKYGEQPPEAELE